MKITTLKQKQKHIEPFGPLYTLAMAKEDSDTALKPHRARLARIAAYCESTFTIISVMLAISWIGLGVATSA